MKTLKEIKAAYAPKAQKDDETTHSPGLQIKSADEKRFADKHVIRKFADRNGNGDDVFNATNVKGVERSPKHGYNPGEDEKVYEEVEDILEYEHGYNKKWGGHWNDETPPPQPKPKDKWDPTHEIYIDDKPYRTSFGNDRKPFPEHIAHEHAAEIQKQNPNSKVTVRKVNEGYVSLAQQRAVWASRKDGGKGHPDNKKKKMKEEVELDEMDKSQTPPGRGGENEYNPNGKTHYVKPISTEKMKKDSSNTLKKAFLNKEIKEANLDEGDVIHFPGKMKAKKEKPDTAPGWMLRKNPELAQKLKDAQDRVKKRKEIKEASKVPMDPEKKAKKAIDDILKMHEAPPSEKGMKIGEAKETESVPFKGPYTKVAKKQPGQKSDPGYSTVRHLARQAMQKMIDKKEKMKEEVNLTEGKVKELEADLKAHLGDHIRAYNAGHLGHDSFGDKVAAVHKKIADTYNISHQHAKKFVNDYVNKNIKESVEYVNEVLKPSMGVGAYISDFVHSKNPKFAGKSKKERMKQALAAYYAAKRGE